ncbi:hypothetical protein BKA66DRAFT_564324 [Pyrenochaeta sp. MPI-SDFR-AT-0127]|nr:hypothetical protein BKA66DRAFT_564324 [Pyrenochaeta sp. MPI-SDFR-AT-0127]
MSYLHLTRTRTRERTPEYDTRYSRPLARRDSNKRQRHITLSDDEDDGHDDYPYSLSHKPAKLSRALTIRNQPSQLERYNIWSDKRDTHSDDDDEERRSIYEKRRTYKYTPHHHNHCDDNDKSDPDEREFRLKVKATFSKPKSPSYHHHHHHGSTHLWPTSLFRTTREKWVDEDWETRERSTSRERRRDSFWGDDEEKDEEKESWSRYRRIKRTKTEEFRPLSGWRRERIVYGS